ncbi:unnamed protein product [Merluccius merluccius]
MYEATAKSIGHKSRNHQDWFDDNSDTIHNLLNDMHKEQQITLDIPSSTNTRQHWKAAQRKVQKDQNSILLRRDKHFDTLLDQDSDADPTILDRPPEPPPIHDLSLPPTFQVVAVHSLENNKSRPATDNIPAELLK